MTRIHNPPDAPPIGRYSQGVEVTTPGRLLHISGQVPQSPDGTVPDGIEAQCELAWANVRAVLRSAEMDVEHLVKVTIFLSDRQYREVNSAVRRRILKDAVPAVTVIITGIYDERWLLEIEAVAFAASAASAA
jgi:2-iminobutanoate/2-iminopropanoate deaminase